MTSSHPNAHAHAPTDAPEYGAVRHLLASPLIASRCAPHIGAGGFDWTALLGEAETMSGGEQLLVRIAHDLWENEGGVRLCELTRRLDVSNFQRVLEALALCRSDLAAGSSGFGLGRVELGPEELADAA
jgi:hypothetical protein